MVSGNIVEKNIYDTRKSIYENRKIINNQKTKEVGKLKLTYAVQLPSVYS
jgi:hypothetical protein